MGYLVQAGPVGLLDQDDGSECSKITTEATLVKTLADKDTNIDWDPAANPDTTETMPLSGLVNKAIEYRKQIGAVRELLEPDHDGDNELVVALRAKRKARDEVLKLVMQAADTAMKDVDESSDENMDREHESQQDLCLTDHKHHSALKRGYDEATAKVLEAAKTTVKIKRNLNNFLAQRAGE